MKALWIGGPPGKTQSVIKAKLKRDGIEIVLWAMDAVSPTKDVDVVLLNKDMCGHTSFAKQKILCKDAATPYVIVHTGYTQTRLALIREGFIDASADVATSVATEPEADEWEESTAARLLAAALHQHEDTMAKTPTPPAAEDGVALRDFLMRLPPNLRSIAIDCVDDLKRKQEDEVVVAAMTGLLILAGHNDDALMRGVRAMKAQPDGAAVLRRLAGAIELENAS